MILREHFLIAWIGIACGKVDFVAVVVMMLCDRLVICHVAVLRDVACFRVVQCTE